MSICLCFPFVHAWSLFILHAIFRDSIKKIKTQPFSNRLCTKDLSNRIYPLNIDSDTFSLHLYSKRNWNINVKSVCISKEKEELTYHYDDYFITLFSFFSFPADNNEEYLPNKNSTVIPRFFFSSASPFTFCIR